MALPFACAWGPGIALAHTPHTCAEGGEDTLPHVGLTPSYPAAYLNTRGLTFRAANAAGWQVQTIIYIAPPPVDADAAGSGATQAPPTAAAPPASPAPPLPTQLGQLATSPTMLFRYARAPPVRAIERGYTQLPVPPFVSLCRCCKPAVVPSGCHRVAIGLTRGWCERRPRVCSYNLGATLRGAQRAASVCSAMCASLLAYFAAPRTPGTRR